MNPAFLVVAKKNERPVRALTLSWLSPSAHLGVGLAARLRLRQTRLGLAGLVSLHHLADCPLPYGVRHQVTGEAHRFLREGVTEELAAGGGVLVHDVVPFV